MRGRVHSEGRIATLFDVALGLDPDFIGYENIFLRGVFLGMSRAEIRERRDAIAAFSELGGYLAMPLRTYSSGMKLRLAFAVSTHVDAEILGRMDRRRRHGLHQKGGVLVCRTRGKRSYSRPCLTFRRDRSPHLQQGGAAQARNGCACRGRGRGFARL
jgi:hypothetical protein